MNWPQGIDRGQSTVDHVYDCVLRIYAGPLIGQNMVASAVLVAPNLALSSAHCFQEQQSALYAQTLLGNNHAEVTALYLQDGSKYAVSSGEWPKLAGIQNSRDQLILLELKAHFDRPAELFASAAGVATGQLRVAAQVQKLIGYAMSAARVDVLGQTKNGMIVVGEIRANGGFPDASGSPAFLDDGNDPPVAIGIEAFTADADPTNTRFPGRCAVYIPLGVDVQKWIDAHRSKQAPRTAMALRRIAAATAYPPSSAQRKFVIVKSNGDLYAEDVCFVDLQTALTEFADGEWQFHFALGHLGVLHKNGISRTSLAAGKVSLSIDLATGGTLDVTNLALVTKSDADGNSYNVWLKGTAKLANPAADLDVYLYRTEDLTDNDGGPRRIRVELFVQGTDSMNDQPEQFELKQGCATKVVFKKAQTPPDDDFRRPTPAQDDIGNGHERK